MDSSERALQINQKLLSNFKLIFVILAGGGGGGICSDQHAFYLSVLNIYCLYQLWLTHGRDCFDEKVEGRT